tara:strand:+ start:204 stop:863 length:660 start_codon:yes stop_codon:yes gene_type:complete
MPAWKNTTLQSSGSISLNQIHVEAGGTSGTQCTLNDQRIRNLVGVKKNSGTQQDFADCYGAYADGHPGSSNSEGQPIAVWGDGPTYGNPNSFVGHSTDTSRQRSFVYGNTFSQTYNYGSSSYTYTNNTSLIQYFARSTWTDEGEGDYDGAVIVVAVAPGGSATAAAQWGGSGNSFSTSNSNLAKIVLDYEESEEYPQYGGGNAVMSGTGTMYPFGVTVD